MSRDFTKIKRVVIKIGTNTITYRGAVDYDYIETMAGQIALACRRGLKPLLVSSGAIGIGAHELGRKGRIRKINVRQACAAIGQPILLHRYKLAFQQYQRSMAQVLLTREVFNNRDGSVNLRNAVETLLELGVIPIFNENDCVSTAEIGPVFGDNDQLSAHIASELDADLLVILSDIDAMYDKDPRVHSDAKPISEVTELTDDLLACAGKPGSDNAIGGMKTKLDAVAIARQAGCHTVIANGRTERVLLRILDGEDVGTVFWADRRLGNRVRWILNTTPKGRLTVDPGAEKALDQRKSLLPSGILDVEGEFCPGDVIVINDRFKAVAASSSTDMRRIKGRRSDEITLILKSSKRDPIARSSDIIATSS